MTLLTRLLGLLKLLFGVIVIALAISYVFFVPEPSKELPTEALLKCPVPSTYTLTRVNQAVIKAECEMPQDKNL